MKQFYTALFLFFSITLVAQIPSGYYTSATGTGYTLKTQLKQIIDANTDGLTPEYLHTPQSYNSMDPFIASNDLDLYYENDTTILDVYSENPVGTDPYNYTPVTDECGNYNGEGVCYNKEHVIPQSSFGDNNMPMDGDGFNLLPTDGRVNNFRSNYPFGVVDDSQLVSQSGISNPTMNGSKLGGNLDSGYSAGYTGIVFEPIDEFKGDIARIYFYFATRYEDNIAAWSSYDMFDGSNDKVFPDTFLSILLAWHQNDPVSQKEIDRNNALFIHQNNRNPYVDHPEYVAQIWNVVPDTTPPTNPTNLTASNPTDTSIDLTWTASTDDVAVASYDIYVDAVLYSNSTSSSATVNGLAPDTYYCFKVMAKDSAGNTSGFSNEVCETTTNTSSSGDCASEDFENIPPNDSAYTDRTWTGTNGSWTATRARTDQTINNRAILIDFRDSDDTGSLTSPTISGGIGDLTVTTQRLFTGTDGTLNVLINGALVGTIPYSDTPQTHTISGINVSGAITLVLEDNHSGSARVGLDDLSWTCYDSLGVDPVGSPAFTLYPNPVAKVLHIKTQTTEPTTVEIYSILGKQVLKTVLDARGTVDVTALKNGIYIVRLSQGHHSTTRKLIKSSF